MTASAISRQPEMPAASPRTDYGHVTKRAFEIIVVDLLRRWSLAELADALATTPRTLQRRFSEDGTSLSKLVGAARLSAACHLLEATSIPVAAIGFLAGYADAAHLTRSFKRQTGLTPTGYRSIHGAAPEAR